MCARFSSDSSRVIICVYLRDQGFFRDGWPPSVASRTQGDLSIGRAQGLWLEPFRAVEVERRVALDGRKLGSVGGQEIEKLFLEFAQSHQPVPGRIAAFDTRVDIQIPDVEQLVVEGQGS